MNRTKLVKQIFLQHIRTCCSISVLWTAISCWSSNFKELMMRNLLQQQYSSSYYLLHDGASPWCVMDLANLSIRKPLMYAKTSHVSWFSEQWQETNMLPSLLYANSSTMFDVEIPGTSLLNWATRITATAEVKLHCSGILSNMAFIFQSHETKKIGRTSPIN